MPSFLSNIGKALRAPGFADRLQAALAAAGGDTGAIPRLRALQMQQAEYQRQNDARDAQVIGAKNMGIGSDQIGALSPQDLSAVARERAYMRMADLGTKIDGLSGGYPGPAASTEREPAAVASSVGAPALDGAAAIQHAADAIQRGADPNAVRARLIQMGHGDQEPPSPFSDLVPKGRSGVTGDFAPPPVQAPPTFDDQGGLKPPAPAAGYAQDRRGKPSQRLDPRLAPRNAGDVQKYSQQKGGARNLGSPTMSTYGLPSLPADGQSRGSSPPRDPAATMNHGLRQAGAAVNPRVPPPAPWRTGGRMAPARVEALADLGMRMYQIHRERGMTPQQAAAWAAAAVAESQGNYHLPQQNNGPAYGLFMWEGPRRRMFEQQFHHPIEQSTEEEQLAFRDWELTHTLSGRARRIPRASSAGDIAAAITQHYETPADWRHSMWDRSNIAEAIMRRANAAPGVARQQR